MPRYEEEIFSIIDNYIKENYKENQPKINQEDLYRELVLDEKAPLRRLLKSNPIEYCFVIHRPSENDNNKEETLLGLLFENNFNTVINKLLDNEFSEEFIAINTIKNSREILPYDQLIKGLYYENSSESLIKLAKRNSDLVACIKNIKNIQAAAKSELEKTKLALQPEIELIEANQKKVLQEETRERDKKGQEEIKRAVHAAEQSKIEAQLQATCEKEEAQLRALNIKHNAVVPPELLGYQPIEQHVDVSKSIIHDDPLHPIASGGPSTFFGLPQPSLTHSLDQMIDRMNQRRRNHPDLAPELNFENEDAVPPQNFPCKKF